MHFPNLKLLIEILPMSASNRFHLWAILMGTSDQAYYKYAKLKGTKGPVNCLSFNYGGELLASGGDDEAVRIWEISTRKRVDVLEDPGRRWGQITCLTWLVNLGNDELKPIAFGTARGLVVIYRRSRVDAKMVELSSNRVFEASDPVEAMAFDEKNSRLAVTSHHGRIAVYDISRSGTMIELWSTKRDEDKKIGSIPRSISFYEGGKKVLVFMLETGEMICHDVDTSREDWRKVLKSGIGHAATCSASRILLVDNLSKGFDLYELPRSSPSHTFSIPGVKRCVKDGAFAEQASAIVCGSDHGKVYIFNKLSSIPIQILAVAGKNVDVQAISTTTTSEAHFIASGVSGGSFDITVWEKTKKKARTHLEIDSNNRRLVNLLNVLVIVLLLHWTSGVWGQIVSQAIKRTLESVSDIVEHTSWRETGRLGVSDWDQFQQLDEEEDDGDDWMNLRGEKWDEL